MIKAELVTPIVTPDLVVTMDSAAAKKLQKELDQVAKQLPMDKFPAIYTLRATINKTLEEK